MKKKYNIAILGVILSAILYAISLPISKILLKEIPPTIMAALLYLGAGIGMSVVSVYYYLKVVKVMYFGESSEKLEPIPVSKSTKLALTISMIVLVVLRIYPNLVINAVLAVSKIFLS